MLHFQEETFARVRDDVQALAQAHWDEVEAALHGEQLQPVLLGQRERAMAFQPGQNVVY